MKKFLIGGVAAGLLFSSLAGAAFAAQPLNPGTYGTASSNAQCNTSAESGAFNAHNLVYGPNSSGFGQSGGAGGGQVGLNNSAVCGNRQGNL